MKRYNSTVVYFLLILMMVSFAVTLSGCKKEDPKESLEIVTAFSPLDLPQLLLWLDASDSDTLFSDGGCSLEVDPLIDPRVGCWLDKSGNDWNATQSSANRRPEVASETLNELSLMEFQDNQGEHFRLPTLAWQAGGVFSAFIVYYQNSGDSTSALFATSPGATEGFAIATVPTSGSGKSKYFDQTLWRYSSSNTGGDWNMDVLVRTNFNLDYYFNGTRDAYYTNLNSAGAGVATLGAFTDRTGALQGMIAEVLWYSQSLSPEERQKVEGYLAHKWGTLYQLPESHPYKKEPPVTVTYENLIE